MKTRIPIFEGSEELNILEFGTECDSTLARWGRGSRDVYILHYVISGRGYFNGKSVSAGQGFYIKPRESHEYHSSSSAPWQYFWITLSGARVDEICKKHISVSEDGIFDYSFSSELIELSKLLFSGKDRIHHSLALSYFFLVMSKHAESPEMSGNAYVNEAKRYIRLNLCYAPTVTEIARELGIDDRYLYNLFIKEDGISPKQYITERRLSIAKKMLTDGGYTVGEIARSVGFSDPLAFSRFFTRHTGISARDFKKK